MTGEAFLLLAQSHGAAVALAAPLLGALACFLAPGPRSALAVSVLALLAAAAGAGAAAHGALTTGPLAYVFAEGLALRIDAWSGAMTAASLGLSFCALLVGGAALLKEADPGPARYGFAAALAAVSAAAAAAYAGNIAFAVLAVQALGLCFAALTAVAGAHRAQALNAALRVLTAYGAAGVLGWFGVGLFFLGAGELEPARAAAGAAPYSALSGLFLLFLAFSVAGLAAPVNHWGAGVLSHGPGLSALLAVTVIGPLMFTAAGRTVNVALDLGAGPPVGVALLVLGCAGAAMGGFQALVARDLRRLSGYAFAAFAGCALLSLALATREGAAAAGLQVLAAAAGTGLLAAAASRGQDMARLDGLARRAPVAALCAALGCFILMSAPFTIGYSASWIAVEAALARGWWPAAGVTVLVSLAGVVFGGRILERMYFRAPPGAAPALAKKGAGFGHTGLSLSGLGLAVFALIALAAGFLGAPLAQLAGQAGEALILWPMEAPQ